MKKPTTKQIKKGAAAAGFLYSLGKAIQSWAKHRKQA